MEVNLVERMIAFRDSQDIAYLDIDQCNSIENLNAVVIEILSWLKLQRKRELWIAQGRKIELKPMDLNFEFPWCNELKSYLKGNNILSEYFTIAGKTLDFKEGIPSDYVLAARDLAHKLYNPPKMV